MALCRVFGDPKITAITFMINFPFASALCLLLVLSVQAQTNVVVDPSAGMTNYTSLGEWNADGTFEGWATSQVSATVASGLLSGTATGTDAQLLLANFSSGPDLDLGFNDFIELRLQVPANYTNYIQIFYGTTSYTVANAAGAFVTAATTGFSANRVITIPAAGIPKDGAFHVYRMDVGLEPSWRATLRDIRIDPLEGAGTSGMAFAIDYIR